MPEHVPVVEFLGWESTAVEAVADRLMDMYGRDRFTLCRCIVVVPTRESGRRLRELLAERSEGGALLVPRVVMPEQLAETAGPGVADEVACMAAWMSVLLDGGGPKLERLFPLVPSERREEWAVGMASQLMQVERVMSDHWSDCSSVREALLASFSDGEEGLGMWVDEEAERWEDMEKLMASVAARMSAWGLRPREEARRAAAAEAAWPSGMDRLVVACVPGLSPLLRRLLASLARASGMPDAVQVWVHAPREMAGGFDEFGMPLPRVWKDREAAVEDSRIHVAADERGMARECLRTMASMEEIRLQDLALGACDERFVAALCTQLGDAGWNVYRPEGRPLSSSGWGGLLAVLDAALDGDGRYEPFEAVLRSPLAARGFGLRASYGFNRLMDKVNQTRFPSDAADLSAILASLQTAEQDGQVAAAACSYVRRVEVWLKRLAQPSQACAAMQELLDGMASSVAPHEPEYAVLERLRLALGTLDSLQSEQRVFSGSRALLQALAGWMKGLLVAEPDREGFALHALGWMELIYSREQNVLLTGLHEGKVPETAVEDAFLPDRLRRVLGWEDSRARMARDNFMLASLLEPRRARGRVEVFVARQDADRNPVRPSSLLLKCADEALPGRVRLLFETLESVTRPQPFERGNWHMCVRGERQPDTGRGMETIAMLDAEAVNPWADPARSFSPSVLARFLRCPLRFWISRLFGLNPDRNYRDGKKAMEFHEYGTLIHLVLEAFVADFPAWDPSCGRERMAARVIELLDRSFAQLAGDSPLAPLMIQKRVAARNLDRFVNRHLQDLKDGWENVAREEDVLWSPDGDTHFRMRIDRIDRHRDGRLRIIDYKTGKVDTCMGKHLEALKEDAALRYSRLLPMLPLVGIEMKGRELPHRWTELQLPLYALAVRDDPRFGGSGMPEVAYYTLPRHAEDVACKPWMIEERLMDSARQWMQETCRLIRRGECLYSAEDLGTVPFEDPCMDALAPDSLRAMLRLPQPAFTLTND